MIIIIYTIQRVIFIGENFHKICKQEMFILIYFRVLQLAM